MFVYILKCYDGSYYTGVTNDLESRFNEHQHGATPGCYTFKRRPVKLVFYEEFQNATMAIEFETRIKKWTRRKKEALIKGQWDKLKEYAKCINESSHLNYSGK